MMVLPMTPEVTMGEVIGGAMAPLVYKGVNTAKSAYLSTLYKAGKNMKKDYVKLYRHRLVNGGFDKVGLDANKTIDIPNVKELDNTFSINNALSNGDFKTVNTREYVLNAKPTYVRITDGSELADKGPAFYRQGDNRIYINKNHELANIVEDNESLVMSHELRHMIDDFLEAEAKDADNVRFPAKAEKFIEYLMGNGMSRKDAIRAPRAAMPEEMKTYTYPSPPGLSDEFMGSATGKPFNASRNHYMGQWNNTEIIARYEQLRNLMGKKSPYDKITVEEWERLKRMANRGEMMDNNIVELFNSVTNPEKFIDWAEKYSVAIAGAGAFGAEASTTDNN